MFQFGAFQGGAFQSAWTTARTVLIEAGGGFLKKRRKSRRVQIDNEEKLKFDTAINEIFDRITMLPVKKRVEVARIVTKKKIKPNAVITKLPEIDIDELMLNMRAVKKLMAIHKQMMQEEEAIVLLLSL